jgi:hypothetical protein
MERSFTHSFGSYARANVQEKSLRKEEQGFPVVLIITPPENDLAVGPAAGGHSRRARRRLAVYGTDDLEIYAGFLEENGGEAEQLCQDLLTGLSGVFFDSVAITIAEYCKENNIDLPVLYIAAEIVRRHKIRLFQRWRF